jgi:Xaa-Pro aminopeptidase
MAAPARDRIASLRGEMEKGGLECLLVSAPSNIFYLCGFRGSAGALLVAGGRAALFSDSRYRLQASEQAPAFEFVEVEQGLLSGVGAAAAGWAVTRLGYEGDHLTCAQRDALAEAATGVEVIPTSGLVEGLRAVKSSEEVSRIRSAAKLADEALSHMVSLLRPGATEREIALEGEFLMRRAGAEAAAFDVIVASGPRGALPHAEATEREVQAGDLVVIDVGARVGGYCSDVTRTFAVASASKEGREVYALAHKAQRAGVAAVRAGAACGEVDAAARCLIEEAGYGEAFGHGLGHGVGIDVHEGPRLRRNEETRLVAGNVVTVEPGIYLPEVGGVRLEDLLLVQEDGAETLTQSALSPELPVL